MSRKILLIDDDPMIMDVFVECLGGRYGELRCSGSVEEALAVLRAEEIHLIVSDFQLGDGTTAFEVIKTVPEIPCVLVSGAAGMPELQVAVNELRSVVWFERKPFTKEKLQGAVEKAIARDKDDAERRLDSWLGSTWRKR